MKGKHYEQDTKKGIVHTHHLNSSYRIRSNNLQQYVYTR
jgi:hypothetical protein